MACFGEDDLFDFVESESAADQALPELQECDEQQNER